MPLVSVTSTWAKKTFPCSLWSIDRLRLSRRRWYSHHPLIASKSVWVVPTFSPWFEMKSSVLRGRFLSMVSIIPHFSLLSQVNRLTYHVREQHPVPFHLPTLYGDSAGRILLARWRSCAVPHLSTSTSRALALSKGGKSCLGKSLALPFHLNQSLSPYDPLAGSNISNYIPSFSVQRVLAGMIRLPVIVEAS